MSKNASNTLSISCASPGLERPRYFPRQLITDTEMSLEQEYFRDRLRLHNRLLHGWGVVCGALVEDHEPWVVKVTRGYALGPQGDEILIDCECKVDLRRAGTGACTGSADEIVDPWCSEVLVQRESGTVWLAVRYAETAARPVRSQPTGCGCDDTECEYSRWQDGFELGLLDECPQSHQGEPTDFEDLELKDVPDCPECPQEPWVVLARVDYDVDGNLTIDNCSCRRLVLSPASLWWRCGSGEGGEEEEVRIDRVEPRAISVEATFTLEVFGENLSKVEEVTLGKNVEVKITSPEDTKLGLTGRVGTTLPGERTMRLLAGGKELARLEKAVTIGRLPTPGPPTGGTKKAAKKPSRKPAKKAVKRAAKKQGGEG